MSGLPIQKKERVQILDMITSVLIPYRPKLKWFIQKMEQFMKKQSGELALKDSVNTRVPMTLKNGT